MRASGAKPPLTSAQRHEASRLVAKCQAGDKAAQLRLYREYSALLLTWARRLAPVGSDPQDIVHDAIMALFRGRGGFRGDSSFEGFLYRIIRNEAHRRVKAMVRLTRFVGLSPPEMALPSPIESRDHLLELRVREALQRLPSAQRDAILLFHIEGRTAPEAAEMLGIPEGTLKSRVRLGKASLERTLGPHLSDPAGQSDLLPT